MRSLVIAATLSAALAACGNPAEDSDEPEPAASATAGAVAQSPAGTYEVTAPDGARFTAALNPDGSYQDTAADGTVVGKGAWAEKDGKVCFDAEDERTADVCYTLGEPQADGTMSATPDDGTAVLTARKLS